MYYNTKRTIQMQKERIKCKLTDVAMAVFPEDFFDRLGLYKIEDKKVMLDFKLLRDSRRRYREAKKSVNADKEAAATDSL